MSFTKKIDTVTQSKKYNLAELYCELAEYLREVHLSQIHISPNPKSQIQYTPIGGNILDDYKTLLHRKLLEKIPGLYNVEENNIDDIYAIFKKYKLANPEPALIKQISDKLDSITDRILIQGTLNR